MKIHYSQIVVERLNHETLNYLTTNRRESAHLWYFHCGKQPRSIFQKPFRSVSSIAGKYYDGRLFLEIFHSNWKWHFQTEYDSVVYR